MMHVAPCGCNLHVRIRELEAELAKHSQCHLGWGPPEGVIDTWKARAEKAEALIAKAEHECVWKPEAERLAARVAELASEVQAFADADYHEPIGHFRERRVLALKIAKEPLDAEQERLHAQEDE